jgi:hypothetical protein
MNDRSHTPQRKLIYGSVVALAVVATLYAIFISMSDGVAFTPILIAVLSWINLVRFLKLGR